MSLLLLDTNIVSYLFKRDSRAERYAVHLLGHDPAITLMTVAELFQWAAMRNWGQPRLEALERYVGRYMLLELDITTCRLWASVRTSRAALGAPISPQNAWMAATALRYDIPLVTHNAQDFVHIPTLQLISEPG
jgi:predicted nucleic acid-binding protein